jgi:hypothetical protein
LVFLYGGALADQLDYPMVFFWVVAVPLFCWSGDRASKPLIAKQIGYWPAVFWAMVVPFSVWALAVASSTLHAG